MSVSVGRATLDDQDRVEKLSQSDKAVKEFKYLWRRYGNWGNERSYPIIAVSDEDDLLVGFHAAAFGRFYVNSYYQLVAPEVRGTGLGGRMVGFLLSEAQRLGCVRLKFKVPHDSEGQRFWEGFGLQPFGKDARHYLYDYSLEGVTKPSDLARAKAQILERDMDRYRLSGIEVL